MTDQLALGVDAATERLYTCCGQPCPPLSDTPPYFDYPHAEDCPNPNLGAWFDRYGRIIRALHCKDRGRCRTRGRFIADERTIDPYGGRCCYLLAP